MVLCADNTLHGQNVYDGQVSGTWTQDVVKFTSVANVSFEGTPSLASLRGTWRMEGLQPDDEEFESGQFDLTIESCESRAWCEELHRFFPPQFKQSVRWLLLSSLRTHEAGRKVVLPCILWPKVLIFTNQDFFELDQETIPSEMKRDLEYPDESETAVKRQRETT